MFGLSLLSAAVEVAGGSFQKHPRILALVTDDLFRNLMQTGQSNNLLVLSLVSGMVLSLYQHLKQHLKLQMAAFFEFVVLRAAQVWQSVARDFHAFAGSFLTTAQSQKRKGRVLGVTGLC